jgi:hypothetical protein
MANRSMSTTELQKASYLPRVFGTGGFRRVFGALLVLELAALAGEWCVHQTMFWLLYGSSFGEALNRAPHRYVFLPLGAVLALAGLFVTAVLVLGLLLRARHRRTLLEGVSDGLRRLMPAESMRVPWGNVLRTALLLLILQAVIYVVQENFELAATGNPMSGLTVLVVPLHGALIGMHLAVALGASTLLWIATALGTRSRVAIEIVAALLRLFALPPLVPVILRPVYDLPARSFIVARSSSPRAPPTFLAAQ